MNLEKGDPNSLKLLTFRHLISSKWFCAWAQDPHLREKKKTMDLIIKAIDDKSVINCDLN